MPSENPPAPLHVMLYPPTHPRPPCTQPASSADFQNTLHIKQKTQFSQNCPRDGTSCGGSPLPRRIYTYTHIPPCVCFFFGPQRRRRSPPTSRPAPLRAQPGPYWAPTRTKQTKQGAQERIRPHTPPVRKSQNRANTMFPQHRLTEPRKTQRFRNTGPQNRVKHNVFATLAYRTV